MTNCFFAAKKQLMARKKVGNIISLVKGILMSNECTKKFHSNNGQRDWFVFSGLHAEKLKDNSWVLLLALRKAESVKSNEY